MTAPERIGHRRGGARVGAACAGATFLLFCAALAPALAQSNRPVTVEDLHTRLERVERDLADLEAQVYRLRGEKIPDMPVADLGIVRQEQFGPVSQRVSDIEQSLRRVTGQVEDLSHSVDQLSQRLDRMQKDMDYRLSSTAPAGASEAGEAGAPGAAGSLGTLPANAPLANAEEAPSAGAATAPGPTAQALATAQGASATQSEFNEAMNELARAQYDTAMSSFRAFADDHPDDDLAPQALYWSGDIAYSAKKDYSDAARTFAELLKKYDKAPRAPEAMLKLGLSLLSLGQKDQGCATLAALPAKYPKASATVSSRARAERRTAHCT